MSQCNSCGGFCGNRCLRDFSDRALNSAVYWQNRCCELEEVIEMFCLDAEYANKTFNPPKTVLLTTQNIRNGEIS